MGHIDLEMYMNLKLVICFALAVVLAGCSSGAGLLDTKAGVPSAAAVPVGNNLALPPDLQLASPAGTVESYQSNGYVAPIAVSAGRPVSQAATFADPNLAPQRGSNAASLQQQAAASPTEPIYSNQVVDRAFPADYYAKYGISRFKSNGKLKTPAELKKELIVTVLAKKRSANPNYGSIANIGNLGSGGDEFIMHP